MTSKELREEVLTKLNRTYGDKSEASLETGIALMDRPHPWRTPAGIRIERIRNAADTRLEVIIGREHEPHSADGENNAEPPREEKSTIRTLLDAAAPLLAPMHLHDKLQQALQTAANADDVTGVRNVLAALAKWMPIPPGTKPETRIPRLAPTLWNMAGVECREYNQRREEALRTGELDQRVGFYLRRHDPRAEQEQPDGVESIGSGSEAMDCLATMNRTHERDEEPSERLTTITSRTETTCWPRYEPISLSDRNEVARMTTVNTINEQEEGNPIEIGVLVTDKAGKSHGLRIDAIAGLLAPIALQHALRNYATQALNEQNDHIAAETLLVLTRWTPVAKPGRKPKPGDYAQPPGLSPAIATGDWQRRLDEAYHLAKRVHKNGRYLRQRRSNATLLREEPVRVVSGTHKSG